MIINTEKEQWKPILGYEGFYEVSSLGRVRSLPGFKKANFGGKYKVGGNILRQPLRNRYPKVDLSVNGVCKQMSVHRLVALNFISNPNNKAYVNHKNGIRSDNRVDNLEWVSAKENSEHALKNGYYKKGNDHNGTKLRQEQIPEIRKAHKTGLLSSRQLARTYGVSQYAIMCVINYKTWK